MLGYTTRVYLQYYSHVLTTDTTTTGCGGKLWDTILTAYTTVSIRKSLSCINTNSCTDWISLKVHACRLIKLN